MVKTLIEINKEFEHFLGVLNPKFDKKKIRKAFDFAKKAHIFQKRETGEPYISHPFEVAKLVNHYGLDDVSIIASFLHDVVDDTKIDLTIIREEFGEETETLVDGLSKITIFGEKKEQNNIEALRKILLASAKDIRILIIKLCDRLHNMRTIEELPVKKRERVSIETLLIYVPIAQKLGMYSLKWELEDLAFKFKNYDFYKFIKSKIRLKRAQRELIVKKAVNEIKDVLLRSGISNPIVLGRPKNFYSIYKKIKNKTKEFEDITDLYAIRVIVKDISDCYSVLGILHEQFQVFPDKLKDYITTPKANGYQSIHSLIFSRSIRSPVEIQIRTDEMHKLAEFGVAAHWKYKNLKEDKKFEKKISWLREVMQWEKEHKNSEDFLKILKFDFFEDEIFVFTPKNDLFTLPENSTVLDFAYAVHSDIGNHAIKAKINGFLTTIDKVLKSGDIVEILTNKNVKPTEKWLKLVNTTKAKIKVRAALDLKHSGKLEKEVEEVFFDKLISKITRVNEFKKIRKAGCCSFSYGEQIVGLIGKNKKELVVHNASCDNAKFTINKKISLNWIQKINKEVELNLILKDRFGIIIDIMNVFSQFNLSISKLHSKVQKNGNVKMSISILDGIYIDKLILKLKKLDSVENVIISRGLFW